MDSDEAPRSESSQSGARNWYTARAPVAPSRRNWYARHEPAADPASSADRPAPQAAPNLTAAAARGELAPIEAAGPVETNYGLNGIDRGYAPDLQRLQQQFNQLYQFSRLYDAQLSAKDQQLAELGRRVEEIERERDALKARALELERQPASAVPATNGADQARHPEAPAAADPEATNGASPSVASKAAVAGGGGVSAAGEAGSVASRAAAAGEGGV